MKSQDIGLNSVVGTIVAYPQLPASGKHPIGISRGWSTPATNTHSENEHDEDEDYFPHHEL